MRNGKTMNAKAKKVDIKLFLYDASRVVLSPCALIFRVKKYDLSGSRTKFSPVGAKIIASNHVSYSDPFIVFSAFMKRRIFFLASELVMKGKFKSFLLGHAGCIKIDRGISDIEAIRKCESVLKDGRIISIFPQGTIDREDKIDETKSGAALLAVRTGAKILPIYTNKRKHFYNRQIVVIGEEIDAHAICAKKFPSVSDLGKISEILGESIENCRKTYERIAK